MPSPCDGKDPDIFTTRTAFLRWKDTPTTGKDPVLTGLAAITTPTTAQTSALTTLLNELITTNACFQEKISAVRGQSTDIASKQIRLLNLEDELKEKEEAVRIGKDRLGYLKDPEHRVNYYDSWFPLHRPLRPQTVPILIALGTFFGLVSFGYLFSLAGIRLLIQMPSSGGVGGGMFSQLTPAFWILFLISLSAIFGIIYRKPS
jgi:hypothetical protein